MPFCSKIQLFLTTITQISGRFSSPLKWHEWNCNYKRDASRKQSHILIKCFTVVDFFFFFFSGSSKKLFFTLFIAQTSLTWLDWMSDSHNTTCVVGLAFFHYHLHSADMLLLMSNNDRWCITFKRSKPANILYTAALSYLPYDHILPPTHETRVLTSYLILFLSTGLPQLSNWLYRSKAKKTEEKFLSDCHSTLTTGWGGKTA